MRLVTVQTARQTMAGFVKNGEILLLDVPDVKRLLMSVPITPAPTASRSVYTSIPTASVSASEENTSKLTTNILKLATGESLPLEHAKLLPVIPHPDKIICLGLNYEEHLLETGAQRYSTPTYFAKYACALTGPYDPIHLPNPEISTSVDWEVELAVIIGRHARNVTSEEAHFAIAGFAVFNDVSVRDWQKRTSQFLAGKTFERSTPLGPALVTTDEIGDGSGLHMHCEVNGIVKQSGNTAQQIFKPADIVSDLSKIMTLSPGDVIATGTPSGIGAARTPSEWLQPGDVVRTHIEGLGELVNTCTINTCHPLGLSCY